jgi:hypothetical protein
VARRDKTTELKAKKLMETEGRKAEAELQAELGKIQRERKLAKARSLRDEEQELENSQGLEKATKDDLNSGGKGTAQHQSHNLPACKKFAAFISHKKVNDIST